VTALGRGVGAASGADVVVAVPGPAISADLGAVPGLAGKIAIDAANTFPSRNEAFPSRNEGFASLAEEVKSVTGAPVAKSFNLNFAVPYDQIAAQRVPPGGFHVAGDGARDVTGRSSRTPAMTRCRSAAWTRPAPRRTWPGSWLPP